MRRRISLLFVMTLIAAACGGDSTVDSYPGEPVATTEASPATTQAPVTTQATTTTQPSAADGFPVSIVAENGEVEIADRPSTIVSLSATSTEILFAIGADDQVAAVDSTSNYPPEAPLTDLSAFTPNIEAIAEFDPDLVVLSFDPGDLVSGLAAIGIPAIVHSGSANLDGTYLQIEQLGAATGNVGSAAELVGQMQAELTDLVDEFGLTETGLTYYHEIDDTYYSATSTTFIGEIYSLLGLVNIADSQDVDGFGFPQLSAEYIIESNPDLIFLADTKYAGQNAETVAARAGWANMDAVISGQIVELDDDIASRWGPRVIDFLETVAEAIRQFEGVPTG